MALPPALHNRLRLPVVGSPLFIISNPDLVIAQCKAGIVGSFPALNARPEPVLEEWLERITSELADYDRANPDAPSAPFAVNQIVHGSNARLKHDMDMCVKYEVPIVITSLGAKEWVNEMVHSYGGIVLHDIINNRFAKKAIEKGADGLIAVAAGAGGHAGTLSPEALLDECGDLGLPLVAAGGVGDPAGYVRLLRMGYGAVQMGTRFIATEECEVHPDYWEAIIDAGEEDIVLTERLSGVPVAVINTPMVQRVGTKAGPIARRLLKGRRTKHWMRTFYALRSLRELKQTIKKGVTYKDVWQAGKRAGAIDEVVPAAAVVRTFAHAWASARG